MLDRRIRCRRQFTIGATNRHSNTESDSHAGAKHNGAIAHRSALTSADKDKARDEMNGYRRLEIWYLTLYYIFILGSALAAATASFLPQLDTAKRSFKRPAQILAFVASVLAIVTTTVNFKTQSVANADACLETRDLSISLLENKVNDKGTFERALIEIEKKKKEAAKK